MHLYALVTSVAVRKIMKFDVDTGAPDPNYFLQVSVTDLENSQAMYQCSFNEGFGLEHLREAKKAKASEADRDAVAAQVEQVAKQMEGQHLDMLVGRAKAKNNFLSLAIVAVQPLSEEFVRSLLGKAGSVGVGQ